LLSPSRTGQSRPGSSRAESSRLGSGPAGYSPLGSATWFGPGRILWLLLLIYSRGGIYYLLKYWKKKLPFIGLSL
jgi:hypothetical protein